MVLPLFTSLLRLFRDRAKARARARAVDRARARAVDRAGAMDRARAMDRATARIRAIMGRSITGQKYAWPDKFSHDQF